MSSSQEPSNIPEAMVLQCKKNTTLHELLESHIGGYTLEVAVKPWPPTYSYFHFKTTKKEKEKGEERERGIQEGWNFPKDLEPQKGAKVAKGAQRKNTPEGSSVDMVADRRPRILV